MSEEHRIDACKASLAQIYRILQTSPEEWREYIHLARTVIVNLDSTTFAQQPSRTQEQIWVIAGLQRFAFADPETGGLPDIVAWCARQWLAIVQREPHNITVLQALAQLWLSRAQPTLSRIHRGENSPDSSHSSGHSRRSASRGSEYNDSPTSSAEAEARAGTADYVEARGFLQPATEYFERAIAAASTQEASTGDLLSTAAETYMSLGNASSPRANEHCFRRAVQLLQIASTIPAYSLNRYLQRYLDDYGRLLD